MPRYGHYVCLCVDVQGYGKRTSQRHLEIQHQLKRVMTQAATEAGVDRSQWKLQGKGDEELALVPLGESESRIVDDFVRHLDARLRGHNNDLRPSARLRLRVAIHRGVAQPAENGFAGQAVVVAARLLNAGPLRDALAEADDANLAVLLSDTVYQETVVGGHTTMQPDEFRRVAVRVKEYVADAWLRVPGVDVHRLSLSPGTQGADQETADQPRNAALKASVEEAADDGGRMTVRGSKVNVNYFQNEVDAQGATFGFSGTGDG
jgi:hypothetical protein